MYFKFLLLLYSLLIRSCRLIGCRDVFNGTKIFFDSMVTVSCWVDWAEPIGELRGLLFVRFCRRHLEASPPSLHPSSEHAIDHSVGGFKTTT